MTPPVKQPKTMKKNFIYAAFSLAVILAAASCQQVIDTPSAQLEQGSISIDIAPSRDLGVTKAVTAYTTLQTYESQVNKVQIFVFDASGRINIYKNLGTSLSGTVSTTAGAKTVWAVVNGPDLSSVATQDALKATVLDLSANSTTAATGFVMAGSGSCTVAGGSSVPCSFSVSRLCARVALVSVTNNLPASYGSITFDRVFLSNVVGNQNLAGTAAASTWYNKQGRKDEATQVTDHIIDGSTYVASCPALTFRTVGQAVAAGATHTPAIPYLFYTYPNSATAAPSGFSASFSAQRTVLTVVATISGTRYYYPVVLDDALVERNKCYTVGLTITGLGSTDPNTPVSKGSINVSLTVAGWTAGATYDEVI